MHFDDFINGKFVPSGSKDRIEVVNPSTDQMICTVPDSDESDMDSALSAATLAQREWARRPAVERAKVLRSIRARIRARAVGTARAAPMTGLKFHLPLV